MFSFRRALCLTTLLTALPLAATAQDSTDAETDEIVVRGQYLYTDQVNALKTPTPIIDVPQSLTIVTDEQILNQGMTSISDVIRYTPGVNTTQGEGHRDAIVFRGSRSTADFFIDGVRDDVQYYRPLYNLEQVEIIRGPNALLFGRGGTGGIVNRVTKKGVFGESFTGFKTSINTFGEHDIQLDVNLSSGDRTAFRINGFYEGLDNHRDFYDGTRYGFNPTAAIRLGPDTKLDLSYEYANHERFIDRGIPSRGTGPAEDLRDVVFGTPEINKNELEAHLFRATLLHDFNENLKANVTVHYGDYDKIYTNLYSAGLTTDGTGADIVTIDGYRDPTQRQNFIASGNLVGEFETFGLTHNVLLGAEMIETDSDNLRFNTLWSSNGDDQETFFVSRPMQFTVDADGNPTSVDFTTDLNNQTSTDLSVRSIYAQDEVDVTDSFKLVLGARFDSFDIEVVDVDDNVTTARKDEEVSPRLGLIYKPAQNISIYGGYSKSFLPRSGEQFKTLSAGDSTLDPDEFENLEAGIKWDINRDLSFTAAIFELEQTTARSDGTNNDVSRIVSQKTNGFELQLQGQVTEKWFVSAGYSYLDGETGDPATRPRELPENMLSVWNNYEVTDRLGLGLGVTYQDESLAATGSPVTLPAYTRVDAAVYYQINDKLRLQVNLENLTDEEYYPDAHSVSQISVGEPINARFTLSGRF